MFNQFSPLGLPDGSVRSILAIGFTATTCFLWATGAAVPEALLAVNALVVGNYFGQRGKASLSEPELEAVEPPYIPGEGHA